VHALAADPETDPLADIEFPEPVVADPEIASRFVRLYVVLESATTRLERDEQLAEWLHTVVERASPGRRARPALTPRDDRAFRLSCEYLAERPERNVSGRERGI
jgi:hypothetical protein